MKSRAEWRPPETAQELAAWLAVRSLERAARAYEALELFELLTPGRACALAAAQAQSLETDWFEVASKHFAQPSHFAQGVFHEFTRFTASAPLGWSSGFVYFFKTPEPFELVMSSGERFNIPAGAIKIGCSNDPKRRLSQLLPLTRLPLTCARSFHGAALERSLHKLFSDLRIGGEWFSPSEEIESLISGTDGVDGLRLAEDGDHRMKAQAAALSRALIAAVDRRANAGLLTSAKREELVFAMAAATTGCGWVAEFKGVDKDIAANSVRATLDRLADRWAEITYVVSESLEDYCENASNVLAQFGLGPLEEDGWGESAEEKSENYEYERSLVIDLPKNRVWRMFRGSPWKTGFNQAFQAEPAGAATGGAHG